MYVSTFTEYEFDVDTEPLGEVQSLYIMGKDMDV